MTEALETAAAAVQDALETALAGVKVFGPIAARDGRVEVSVSLEADGAAGAPVNLMAEELESTGAPEEAAGLALAVAGAANVSGMMRGKFVYLRQFSTELNDYVALVALHLEPVRGL
jgi:hypothetical protein